MEYYLIGINALGFVLYGIHARLYPGMKAGWGNAVLTAVVLAGGSLGVLLSILVFDGKTPKKQHVFLEKQQEKRNNKYTMCRRSNGILLALY